MSADPVEPACPPQCDGIEAPPNRSGAAGVGESATQHRRAVLMARRIMRAPGQGGSARGLNEDRCFCDVRPSASQNAGGHWWVPHSPTKAGANKSWGQQKLGPIKARANKS